MSKRQWGHGFHTGYKKALDDVEIRQVFEQYPNAHWVPVKFPKDEEVRPKEPLLCRFNPDHGIYCESRSGGCGGNTYLFREDYLLCTEPYKAKMPDGV